MRTTKLLMVALTAALALAAATGTALARTAIRVSPSGPITAIARGFVFLGETESATRFTCDVTLSGSLHSQISKIEGSLVGYITRGSMGGCASSSGSATRIVLLFPAPWHVKFVGFSGTLPRIELLILRLEALAFLLDIGGGLASCLYRGSVLASTSQSVSERRVTSFTPGAEFIPVFSRGGIGGFACPERGRLTGTSFAITSPAGGIEVILVG